MPGIDKKYVFGLSYVNYNMLVTNWDSSNVEDILMPRMFEDIYRIYTGENLKTENWEIPADVYEKIMTTYFPVSKEKLRNHFCAFSNCIVVQSFQDGTFRYLSNSIEKKELDIPIVR